MLIGGEAVFGAGAARGCVRPLSLYNARFSKRDRAIDYVRCAGIAQLVEHNLAKVGVAGSNPVSRSIGWLAQLVERSPYKA